MLDAQQQTFVDIVDKHGWHVMNVFDPEKQIPDFSYTTGLWKQYRHPEIILIGQPAAVAHGVLNTMGAQVRDERMRFTAGGPYKRVLAGYDAWIVNVSPDQRDAYLWWSGWYYREHLQQSEPFPAVQCVWPSEQERAYPWDSRWPPSLARTQPVLGRPLLPQ